MMSNEKLNDKQLATIASRVTSVRNEDIRELTQKAFDGTTLTNAERNELLEHITQNQFAHKPISMQQMKQDIFRIVEYSGVTSGNTISRNELKAIHDYITRPRGDKG